MNPEKSDKSYERIEKRLANRRRLYPDRDNNEPNFEEKLSSVKNNFRASTDIRERTARAQPNQNIRPHTGRDAGKSLSEEMLESEIQSRASSHTRDHYSGIVQKAREESSKKYIDCLQVADIIKAMIESVLRDEGSFAQTNPDDFNHDLVLKHLEILGKFEDSMDINEVLFSEVAEVGGEGNSLNN